MACYGILLFLEHHFPYPSQSQLIYKFWNYYRNLKCCDKMQWICDICCNYLSQRLVKREKGEERGEGEWERANRYESWLQLMGPICSCCVFYANLIEGARQVLLVFLLLFLLLLLLLLLYQCCLEFAAAAAGAVNKAAAKFAAANCWRRRQCKAVEAGIERWGQKRKKVHEKQNDRRNRTTKMTGKGVVKSGNKGEWDKKRDRVADAGRGAVIGKREQEKRKRNQDANTKRCRLCKCVGVYVCVGVNVCGYVCVCVCVCWCVLVWVCKWVGGRFECYVNENSLRIYWGYFSLRPYAG